jgi:hypothetical protein
MKRITRHLLLCAAGALIASCASQSSTLPAGMMPRASTSWVAPQTSTDNLIYVSNADDEVTFYNYADGTLEGVLTGFQSPKGLCADKTGNVYVTDASAQTIVEYAHSATQATKTLDDAPDSPYACSIDPKSGDLAVADNNGQSVEGDVAIWAHASGTPVRYTDSAIYAVTGCTYDAHGNLFASGVPEGGYSAQFAWMPHGTSRFTNLFVPGPYSNRGWGASGVGWDGRYFIIDDYSISRILVTHGQAYYAGHVGLSASTPFAFYYQRGIATAAIAGVDSRYGSSVDVWNYPAGGDPTLSITHGLDEPFGVALSLAK